MDKKEAKKLMDEVRHIINEWDFLAAAALGVNDEYDCLVASLTSLIAKRADRATLRDFIEKDLADHFGVQNAYSKDNLEIVLDKLLALEERR
jgi:hypothetical protein